MRKRRNFPSSPEAWAEHINSIPVTKDDLLKLLIEMNTRRDNAEDVDWELAMILSVTLFDDRPDVGEAVHFRMSALAELLDEDQAGRWSSRVSDHKHFTQAVIFAAAAIEPLVVKDQRLAFDPKTFLNKVLELAEPQGHG